MVFVDGSYLFHACRRFKPGWKIDHYKLVTRLVGPNRTLIRAYFYTGVLVPPSQAQVGFHRALTNLGFSVVTRPLKERGITTVEKGIEAALVTDFLGSAFRNAYDTAILISGDSDFLPAVDEVKRLGKRVEVAAFTETVSEQMRMTSDRFHGLEGFEQEASFPA